jgi:hypothetical protein
MEEMRVRPTAGVCQTAAAAAEGAEKNWSRVTSLGTWVVRGHGEGENWPREGPVRAPMAAATQAYNGEVLTGVGLRWGQV